MKEIFDRRSIRKYKPGEISVEKLRFLVKAGMYAPSAGNEQPWDFIIINERGILDKIPEFHPHAQMLKQAPAAILVCADITREKHKDMWIQDCSAATENILIEITAQGLGGVWLGVYPREERIKGLKELLAIPAHVIPFSLIAVGFPAERKLAADRFNPQRLHLNKW